MNRPLLLVLLSIAGCGGTTFYRPGASWRIATDHLETTDGDIETAFEASPQMPPNPRIAYFTFDADRASDLGAMLRDLPSVSGVHEIAPLWVTGQRRYEEAPLEPRELSVRQLRLLAARAHCDVLVVVDHGHRIERAPNAWVALNVLLVPTFFTPQMDADVESYVDAYVIDTRNGYLYGHLSTSEEDHVSEMTIWSDADSAIAREHWSVLLGRTREALLRILADG